MYLLSIANRVRASELLKGFATTTFWSALSKLLIVLTTLYCSNVLTQDELAYLYMLYCNQSYML